MGNPRVALRQAREARGWTQEQAAVEYGYNSKSTVSMQESGQFTPPLKMMLHIARVLGVKAGDIWEELREEGDHGPAA